MNTCRETRPHCEECGKLASFDECHESRCSSCFGLIAQPGMPCRDYHLEG